MTAARVITNNAQSAASAIDAALSTGVPVVLTRAMLESLVLELGSADRVLQVLNAAVELSQRPLAINTGSTTVILKPSTWSEERAMGWLGGIYSDLEDEFGTIASVRPGR